MLMYNNVCSDRDPADRPWTDFPAAFCFAIRIYELTPSLPRPLLLSMRRFALPAAKQQQFPLTCGFTVTATSR